MWTGRPAGAFLVVALSPWAVHCTIAESPTPVATAPVTSTQTPTVTVAVTVTPTISAPTCGPTEDFDRDGDGLSDAVEAENAQKGFRDLRTGRCDEDPSEARGRPHRGRLRGGLNLPDRGDGFYHFLGTDNQDTDDWGTLALVACLEAVGRRLAEQGIRLGVGDLSLRRGGSFPPHSSHQNGLDVDLRYVRRDRRRIPLDLRLEPDAYDAEATKVLFDAFFEGCSVRLILADTDRLVFDVGDRPVLHAAGHSNHIHVRLRKEEP